MPQTHTHALNEQDLMFAHNIVNKSRRIEYVVRHTLFMLQPPLLPAHSRRSDRWALRGRHGAADTRDYYITLNHLVLSFILRSHRLFFIRISNEMNVKSKWNETKRNEE